MAIDERQLRCFIEVADCGSISRAAATLHIAQPALSRRMRQLEHQVGRDLFERTPGGVQLTNAGQRLYLRANAWAEEFGKLQKTIQQDVSDDLVALKLGMAPGPTTLLLGRIIAAARSEALGKKLRVVELDRSSLYEQVLTQQLAMAISTEVPQNNLIISRPLWVEDLFLVAHPRRSGNEPFPPFVIPSNDPYMYSAVIKAAAALGITPDDELVVTPTSSVKRLIMAGAACSVLPYSAIRSELADKSLHLEAVPGGSITRTLFWLRHHSQNAPSVHLLELIERCVASMLAESESPHLRGTFSDS